MTNPLLTSCQTPTRTDIGVVSIEGFQQPIEPPLHWKLEHNPDETFQSFLSLSESLKYIIILKQHILSVAL